MAQYPVLSADFETRLNAVVASQKSSGMTPRDYLNDPTCPYGGALKAHLLRILGGGVGGVAVGGVGDIDLDAVENLFDVKQAAGEGDKFTIMLQEVELTISQVAEIERLLKSSGAADASDFVSLMKTKTSLMEKWVNLKGNIFTLKEMSEFQAVVLGIVDELLDVDGRAELKKRLRGLRSVEELNMGQKD